MQKPSVITDIGEGNFAGFPAVGTVVIAISAEANVVLAFANGAVLFAIAAIFRLVAYGAAHRFAHGSLH
jgi:hypothetical protein